MFSVTRPHNKVGIFGQESRKKCSKNIDKKGGKKKTQYNEHMFHFNICEKM